MPPIEPLLDHLIPFTLVVARLGGLMLLGPVFSSVAMPARLRAMVAVILGLALYQMMPAGSSFPRDVDLLGLVGLLVAETGIGMVIGLLAMLPLTALELAGMTMGHQMGLGLARSYNPELQSESDVLGQMLYIFAVLSYIALGGIDTLFVTLARTYAQVPVGAASFGTAPLELMTAVMSSGFELALRVAAPVALIVLAVLVVIGLIGKTVPQLNVMTLGFMVKIPIGLALLAASLVAVATATGDEMRWVQGLIDTWITGMGSALDG